jgi:hypothetical protein
MKCPRVGFNIFNFCDYVRGVHFTENGVEGNNNKQNPNFCRIRNKNV